MPKHLLPSLGSSHWPGSGASQSAKRMQGVGHVCIPLLKTANLPVVTANSIPNTKSPNIASMTVEIGSPCAFFMRSLFSCCFCCGGI